MGWKWAVLLKGSKWERIRQYLFRRKFLVRNALFVSFSDTLFCFGFLQPLAEFNALITSGWSCEDPAECLVKPIFCHCLNFLEMMDEILSMLKSVGIWVKSHFIKLNCRPENVFIHCIWRHNSACVTPKSDCDTVWWKNGAQNNRTGACRSWNSLLHHGNCPCDQMILLLKRNMFALPKSSP